MRSEALVQMRPPSTIYVEFGHSPSLFLPCKLKHTAKQQYQSVRPRPWPELNKRGKGSC